MGGGVVRVVVRGLVVRGIQMLLLLLLLIGGRAGHGLDVELAVQAGADVVQGEAALARRGQACREGRRGEELVT